MLHKYLQGNSITGVILTCGVESVHLQSTLSTLRFGQHVGKLKNCIKMNKEVSLEMLRLVVTELELRIRCYQRQEQETENKRENKSREDETIQKLKAAFEDATEERDLLKAELDVWLDERNAEHLAQAKREEHFLTQINLLNTKLSSHVASADSAIR
jgi:hypothetical protein